MAAYTSNVWNQIKSITINRPIKALNKDGWIEEETRKNTRAFIKFTSNGAASRRVVLHPHPGKSFGPSLLKSLLKDIGWTEEDLRRLGLIK